MLIGIDARVTPELMDLLMRMGHGDELAVVDANYPATTSAAGSVYGEVITLPGFDAPGAIDLITGLLPLDGFSDACALRMEIDAKPDHLDEVHAEAFAIIHARMPEGATTGSIERQAFYQRAGVAFGIVATTEARPFGCFILRKGVIL